MNVYYGITYFILSFLVYTPLQAQPQTPIWKKILCCCFPCLKDPSENNDQEMMLYPQSQYSHAPDKSENNMEQYTSCPPPSPRSKASSPVPDQSSPTTEGFVMVPPQQPFDDWDQMLTPRPKKPPFNDL